MEQNYGKIAEALIALGRVGFADLSGSREKAVRASEMYSEVRDPTIRAGFVRYLDSLDRQDSDLARRGIGNMEIVLAE